MKKQLILLLSFSLFILFSGCTSKKNPAWINQGGAAFPGDKGKLYGVGRAAQSVNPTLMVTQADDAARVDIAKILTTYVANLSKNFQQETRDFQNPEQTESLQLFSNISKTVTDATLVGSQIIDRFYDEDGKIQYSLAILTVDDVLNAYQQKAQEAVRRQKAAFIEGKSEDALKALDEAIDKERKAHQ